jgi:hypothetical protein
MDNKDETPPLRYGRLKSLENKIKQIKSNLSYILPNHFGRMGFRD